MRATIVSLAGAAALAFSGPLAAQGDGSLSYDVPMDCGIANAYLSGLVEDEDPFFAEELLNTATVWLLMSKNRFVDQGADFDSRVDARTEELTRELAAMTGEEEIIDFFDVMLSSCKTIQSAYSDEYDQAEAAIK